MTTREMLNRRFYRGMLCIIPMAIALGIWQTTSPIWTTHIAVIAIGLGCLAIVLRYKWQTSCAQCGKPLGWMAMSWMPAQDANTSPPCPNCGVSIDRDKPS